MDNAAKAGVVNTVDAEQAQLDLDMAGLSVKAAEIRVAQAKLGPEPSMVLSGREGDMEWAKLQVAAAQVEREMAQVKVKHCEEALARCKLPPLFRQVMWRRRSTMPSWRS